MKKKFNLMSIITAVLMVATVAMVTVPAMADSDFTSYKFTFSFDYGNTASTAVEYKATSHAISMYCTEEDGSSGASYAAAAYGVRSLKCSSEHNLYKGKKAIMYGTGIIDEDVYIKGKLNAYDVDAFSGYWYPDDPDY